MNQNETTSAVNHPEHYSGRFECIDEMIALFGVEDVKAFCRCNVYKYRFRADRKNGSEDIKKAEWYMGKLMELDGMAARKSEPRTNGNMLRAMSDHDLAHMLVNEHEVCNACDYKDQCTAETCFSLDCYEGVEKWLNKEV